MEMLPVADGEACSIDGARAPQATGLSDTASEEMAALFKALADPVRLRLYTRIASQDSVCVCDIQDVGVSQPTVSHHLKKLRDAGLIAGERRGTWVHYRAIPERLELLRSLL